MTLICHDVFLLLIADGFCCYLLVSSYPYPHNILCAQSACFHILFKSRLSIFPCIRFDPPTDFLSTICVGHFGMRVQPEPFLRQCHMDGIDHKQGEHIYIKFI